jgi:hypothetical protein
VTSKLSLVSSKSRGVALLVLVCAALAGAGYAQEITVKNETGVTVKMTAAEIAAMLHQELSVDDHGKAVRFDGVIVSVSLRCSFCNQTSVEHMVAETERFDPEQMARILSRQSFDCQFCRRTLPNGTLANARAERATPSRLEHLGFPSSRTH